MKFLYRYVLRGYGLVFVLAMLTILWTACNQEPNRSQEQKAKDEAKRTLDAMHKGADAEIKKYTSGQTKPAAPARKENTK